MTKEQIAKECARNTNYIDMTLEDREKEILSALTRLEQEILSCRNVEAEEWKSSSQKYHRCNTALVSQLRDKENKLAIAIAAMIEAKDDLETYDSGESVETYISLYQKFALEEAIAKIKGD